MMIELIQLAFIVPPFAGLTSNLIGLPQLTVGLFGEPSLDLPMRVNPAVYSTNRNSNSSLPGRHGRRFAVF